MDKDFMMRYYETFYDDPVGAAVLHNEEYEESKKRLRSLEEKFQDMIGHVDSDAWEMYETCMYELLSQQGIICREAYLMGARDRERMLR